MYRMLVLCGMSLGAAMAGAQAQTPAAAPANAPPPAAASPAGSPAASAKAADSLSLYFDAGSAKVNGQSLQVLDQAARTYREGKPIVMVVSGATDSTGSASVNLRLSQQRANNVMWGLVRRGIPVDRFQVLAKGVTEPAVPDTEGKADPRNRRVEITWR